MEKSHRKLDRWKMAMELAGEVYQVTDSFPGRETYSLTDQIRRAAISIPSNIAEGTARQTKKVASSVIKAREPSGARRRT